MPVRFGVGDVGAATYDGWHGYFDEGGLVDVVYDYDSVRVEHNDDYVYVFYIISTGVWTASNRSVGVLILNKNSGSLEANYQIYDSLDSTDITNNSRRNWTGGMPTWGGVNLTPRCMVYDPGAGRTVITTTTLGLGAANQLKVDTYSGTHNAFHVGATGDMYFAEFTGTGCLRRKGSINVVDIEESLDGVDLVYASCTDTSNNSYFFGRTNNGTPNSIDAISIFKWDNTATYQDSALLYLYGDSGDSQYPMDCKVDSSNNIYLLWYADDNSSAISSTLVTKFNSSLVEQWTVDLNSYGGATPPEATLDISPDGAYVYVFHPQEQGGVSYATIQGLDVTDGSVDVDMRLAPSSGSHGFYGGSIDCDSSDVFIACAYDTNTGDSSIGGIACIRLPQADFDAAAGSTYGVFDFTAATTSSTDQTSSTTVTTMPDSGRTTNTETTTSSSLFSSSDEATSISWGVTRL